MIIAAIVTLIDIVLGIAVAWVIVRYNYLGKDAVDTLLDLPVIVPTSALGLSVFLFWGTRTGVASLIGLEGGLFSPGPMLIMALHIVFCLPYVVRSMIGVISQLSLTQEHAAWTLGAPSFTTFRTVGLPQMIPGIISGGILAFTRSVSETGATMIVAGAYGTAPVLIADWKETLLPGAAFIGVVLVAISFLLVIGTRSVTGRWKVPLVPTRPKIERSVSSPSVRKTRDALLFLFLMVVILIPTCFITVFSVYGGGISLLENQFWVSLAISFGTAFFVTFLGLVTGIPLAMVITRGRSWERARTLLDAMVNISVMVPTSALALSLYLFWGPEGLGILDFGLWLVIITHVTLAYPYVVRPIIAALETLNPTYEEAAKTLGGRPFTVFRTITYPVIKPAILAGVIMAFTRSVSETGATMVASKGTLTTVPVFIVEWVKPAISEYIKTGAIQPLVDAAIASSLPCALLLLISFGLLIVFRYTMRRVGVGVVVKT